MYLLEKIKQKILFIKLLMKKNKRSMIKNTQLKPAEGNSLTNIASLRGINRVYFGSNKNRKPCHSCFWDDTAHIIGWYENDESLRKRTLDAMKGTK